jgi:hypothetical protein
LRIGCPRLRAVVIILDKLQLELTAQRIFQDLVSEHGFTGKYSSMRRYVQRLGHRQAQKVAALNEHTGQAKK